MWARVRIRLSPRMALTDSSFANGCTTNHNNKKGKRFA